MELQITTLIENMPDINGKLAYEHGLSFYIEFEGKKMLFDTGQTGAFVDNARSLHKDLSQLDTIMISHGHYDHSGGVKRVLPYCSKDTPMYVGEEFFEPKYKKTEDQGFQYNGIDFTREDLHQYNIHLVPVNQEVTYLTDHILLFKNFKRRNMFEPCNPRFYIKKQERYIMDDFQDEIVLGLITIQGLVVVAGCSHAGIVNILSHITERVEVPIYALIGGTHLMEANQERLDRTIDAFHAMKINKIALSHCTGTIGMEQMQQQFPKEFILNTTGNVIAW